MKSKKNRRKSVMAILFAVAMIASISVVISPVMANNNASSENDECITCSGRTLPPTTPPSLSLAPGYCPSSGGSHLYESIQSVSYAQKPGGTLTITVIIWIANPTGCVAGQPCPEYDDSPEYINAWIDWDGDKVFESHEKVLDAALTGYLGINYHGTMSTSNIVTIPADAVSSTWMRVNLGWDHDPNDPCEGSWTWGDVVDKELLNIKVVQLDALNDIAIKDISDPIWKKQFDADGNLVDVTPKEDDPIADDMKSGSFKIKATLDAFPNKPPWNPKVEYAWNIPGSTAGAGSFNGWEGTFDVSVPQKVGEYTLQLQFTFKDTANNIIGSQSINRKLYITYDNPILSPPKEIWLEKSTAWATGATNPSEVTSTLTQGIYTNSRWLYRDSATSWQSLVEGLAAQGNCVSFSNVWNNLNKVLGVGGSSTQQTRGSHNVGFVTKPATALDGLKGNAHPPSGSVNRWVFGMHQVGKYSSKYYDPTFGAKYAGIFDFIDWHLTGVTGTDANGFYYEANGHKVYQKSSNPPWGDYEYHSPSNPENTNANNGAEFTGNYFESGVDTDGDGAYNCLTVDVEVDVNVAGDYSIFGLLKSDDTTITSRSSKDSMGLSGYYLSSGSGIKTVTLSFSGQDIYDSGIDGIYTLDLVLLDESGIVIDQASFDTSTYSHAQFGEIPAEIESSIDYGEDTNCDGLYDYLSAEISIKVIGPMKYSVEGVLYSNEDLITTGYNSADLSIGTNTMELNFEGRVIRESKFDGPYTLIVILYDENCQQIDYKEFPTSAYSYTDFQQSSASFRDIYSDYGMDTDGDGLYNYLTTEAEVKVLAPGTYTIFGWLSDSSEESDIICDSEDLYLDAGVQSVQLNFDGMVIYKHGTDGPYILSYLALYDENGNLMDYRHDAYTTSAYSYTDFQKPEGLLVELTGNYNDYATDIDSDGVFDYLTVDVEVMLANPGYCIIKARLMDINEEEIVWAENTAYLEADTPQIIQLNFDGKTIYNHSVNGPYYLRDVYIYHTGDPTQPDYVYDAYTTAPYSYLEFGPLWQEINAKLDALIVNVTAAEMPNIIKQRLIDKLEYAKVLKENAKEECEAGNFEGATKKLGVAKSQVESFASMVKITRRISPADKASFLADSTEIKAKIDELIEYIETEHKC